jgi:hypothetical protein
MLCGVAGLSGPSAQIPVASLSPMISTIGLSSVMASQRPAKSSFGFENCNAPKCGSPSFLSVTACGPCDRPDARTTSVFRPRASPMRIGLPPSTVTETNSDCSPLEPVTVKSAETLEDCLNFSSTSEPAYVAVGAPAGGNHRPTNLTPVCWTFCAAARAKTEHRTAVDKKRLTVGDPSGTG